MRNSRKAGGCLEAVIPIMFVLALFVAAFTLTDTSAPKLNVEAVGLPAISLPANLGAGQQAASSGSLAAYTSGVRNWESKILEWERRYNVDRHIIATIMQVESCGEEGAVNSSSGAQGLFQVMPFHFSSGENMRDPDTNARRAMEFFLRMHAYTGYDVYRTFAGYNGGYAAANTTFGYWKQETQEYYILAKGIYDDMKAGLNPSPTIQNAVAGIRCPA